MDGCLMHIENPSVEFCAAVELFGAGPILFQNQKELS
jgi:hypothetical protein